MFSTWNVICGLALVVVIVLYMYITRNFNYWKFRNVPYKKPLPFLGNLIDILLGESPGLHFSKLYAKFNGPYFGYFALETPVLVVKDPQIIKRILVNEFSIFSNRIAYSNENIDPIISNVLLAIKTPTWKFLREKVAIIFTTGQLKLWLPLIKDCCKNMQGFLNSNLNISLDTKELSAKLTTNIVATCALGISTNPFDGESNLLRACAKTILFNNTFTRTMQPLAYIVAPNLVRLLRLKFFDPDAVRQLRTLLTNTFIQRKITKVRRNDLIDILLDLHNNGTQLDEFRFDGNRLLAPAIGFFAVGHETTSTLISLALYELALNNDIQNRLRKEIQGSSEVDEELTYHEVQNMKYLHMVISETLRKYPLSAFIQRQCSKDYLIPETGLVIERGVVVIIPHHGLHCDPKHFSRPATFDPERFNEANVNKIAPYTYLPFGAGPRSCLGERFGLLSAKLGVVHVIKHFQVVRNANTPDFLSFNRSFLLQPIGGIPLTFKKLLDAK